MTGPWWAYVLLGAVGGVLMTVFVWSLCAIAGKTERQMKREEEARHE